jgi:hypothetical protein
MVYFNHQQYKRHIDTFDSELVDALLAELRPMIDFPPGDAAEFRARVFNGRVMPLYRLLKKFRTSVGGLPVAWPDAQTESSWKTLEHWITLLGRDYLPQTPTPQRPEKKPGELPELNLDPPKEARDET